MEGYDKLSFIDKIRFRLRVRQQEKLEDKRQALEHDDRIPVDKQGIINELLAERYNKKNKIKSLPITENNIKRSNTLKQYEIPKDTIKNPIEILKQKELEQILGKSITSKIDAYENIIDLQTFLSYPHDIIPDAENKINEKLFYIQEVLGHDVLNKGIQIYENDKFLRDITTTLSLQDKNSLRQKILNNPKLSEQLNNLRYNPEKTKEQSGKIINLLAIYSNMVQESKNNEYNSKENEHLNELQ